MGVDLRGIAATIDKNKKTIGVICVCLIVVAIVVVAVVIGIRKGGEKNSKEGSSQIAKSSKLIHALCQPTDYKDTRFNALEIAAGNTSDPKELIMVGFQVAVNALKEAMRNVSTLKHLAKDSRTSQALEDCEELMDSAIDDMENSFYKMGAFDMSNLGDYVDELKILLSGAITFEESCLDEFENITNNDAGEKMRKILQPSRELTSNVLAMMSGIPSAFTSLNKNRKLLSDESFSDQIGPISDENGYPSWVSFEKRKLLAANPLTIKPDVIVATDGSGHFRNITPALNTVPKHNTKIFVIYVKAGVYKETVMVTKEMTNVMFLGDGPTKTKITDDKNYVDGLQTMKTATFSALGDNFMAKDIGFENSAGPIKHQAVALRVQSAKSVFYNCQIDGYQDSLYVHAHTQFYRDCTITGTIDFIFGDAAVVFQNCKMVIRKPLDNQNCIVTAQARKHMQSTTGIVLQNCTITGDPAYLPLKNVNKAYLGRPWRKYSRTIIMQSQIDDIIQPEGWLPWDGDFALNTCWYAEYDNRGPGAVQTGRVTWNCIKKIDANQANSFTVAQFIKDDWINSTGVPYVSGLMQI